MRELWRKFNKLIMECKKHCKCYLLMLESRREGAKKTNKNYTTEKRKLAWKKHLEKKAGVSVKE